MKRLIFLLVLLFGFLALADVMQIGLGQNASLQPGDTAIVQYGNYTSAVTCSGGPVVQPGVHYVDAQILAQVSPGFQTPQLLPLACQKWTGDIAVQQARTNAVSLAKQRCVNEGNRKCVVPENQDDQVSYYLRGISCLVVAHILAIN